MDVLDWIKKANKFDSNKFLDGFGVEIIQDENVIDIQRQQWGDDGKDSKGSVIGFYKKKTEELSGGRKIAGTPWTLNNTGDFWSRTFLTAAINGKDLLFQFNSTGINKDKLFETIQFHGEITDPDTIFGLYDFYQKPFIKLIEPKFVEQLNNYYDV